MYKLPAHLVQNFGNTHILCALRTKTTVHVVGRVDLFIHCTEKKKSALLGRDFPTIRIPARLCTLLDIRLDSIGIWVIFNDAVERVSNRPVLRFNTPGDP
jgi:hypothetical protein